MKDIHAFTYWLVRMHEQLTKKMTDFYSLPPTLSPITNPIRFSLFLNRVLPLYPSAGVLKSVRNEADHLSDFEVSL